MIIRLSDISMIKMSVKPPQCVVDADFCIIHNGNVCQYTGISWIIIREAAQSDYDKFLHRTVRSADIMTI